MKPTVASFSMVAVAPMAVPVVAPLAKEVVVLVVLQKTMPASRLPTGRVFQMDLLGKNPAIEHSRVEVVRIPFPTRVLAQRLLLRGVDGRIHHFPTHSKTVHCRCVPINPGPG